MVKDSLYSTRKRTSVIKEKAQHIYHLQSNCFVPDGIAEEVVNELNEYPGTYAMGDSQGGHTLIGPCI